MPPINSTPYNLSSEHWFYRRDDDNDDSSEKDTSRNKGDDDNDDHKGDNSGNNHNSNDDQGNNNNNDDEENNNSNNNGGSGGGGGFGFGFGGGSTNNGGNNSGGGGSNSGGGNSGVGSGSGGGNRIPSSFTMTSIEALPSATEKTRTGDASSTTTSITVFITPESSTAPFLPTPTVSSSTIAPTSPSDNALATPSPNTSGVPQGTGHGLSLGSIVAIILGILFCITISGVIFVITRPKFGSLARLWKKSERPGSHFPSTLDSFEPKQQRSSSNLYRRYDLTPRPFDPTPRPFSRTFFDLQAFRFGSPGNAIAQNAVMPNPPRNLVTSNIAPPMKYDDFQTHQIYSTRMPPPSAVIKSNTSRSVSSKASKQQTFSSLSSRIMSMIDTFSDSGAGSGRASLQAYEWKPPRHNPASEGHA